MAMAEGESHLRRAATGTLGWADMRHDARPCPRKLEFSVYGVGSIDAKRNHLSAVLPHSSLRLGRK
jgi:hypothetical protein